MVAVFFWTKIFQNPLQKSLPLRCLPHNGKERKKYSPCTNIPFRQLVDDKLFMLLFWGEIEFTRTVAGEIAGKDSRAIALDFPPKK